MIIIMIIIIKKVNNKRKITTLFCVQIFQFVYDCNNILSLKKHVYNENVAFSLFYKHLLRISLNNVSYRN